MELWSSSGDVQSETLTLAKELYDLLHDLSRHHLLASRTCPEMAVQAVLIAECAQIHLQGLEFLKTGRVLA